MWNKLVQDGVRTMQKILEFIQAGIGLALRYPVILFILVLLLLGTSSKGKVKLFGQEISVG